MTLGLEWNEDARTRARRTARSRWRWRRTGFRFVLERPIAEEAGTRWLYCGGASALLGRLIAKGTGQPLQEFAPERPLRAARHRAFEWMAGRDGVASAASGFRLAPRDLARIGQAVLDRGRWSGREVIPVAWLDEALRPRVRIDEGTEYGYQWYRGTFPSATDKRLRWVGGMGNGGQRLIVVPDRDLVVAITAGNYNSPEGATTPTTILHDVILASLRVRSD